MIDLLKKSGTFINSEIQRR